MSAGVSYYSNPQFWALWVLTVCHTSVSRKLHNKANAVRRRRSRKASQISSRYPPSGLAFSIISSLTSGMKRDSRHYDLGRHPLDASLLPDLRKSLPPASRGKQTPRWMRKAWYSSVVFSGIPPPFPFLFHEISNVYISYLVGCLQEYKICSRVLISQCNNSASKGFVSDKEL